MDLGIAGRRAIVCASSKGLGRACAAALVAEGVDVVVNGRDAATVAATAAELAGIGGGAVSHVAADVNTAAGRTALVAACPAPDILVTNNAGPAPGRIGELGDDDLRAALEAQLWAPLAMLRLVLAGMRERRFGRIVNITSAMVTRPSPGMVGSVIARTGLTGAMKAVSIEVAADNVTINNILPERIDSGRQVEMARREAAHGNITYDEARRRQSDSIAAKRHGLPSEVGAACAFLCSVQASFISGQNLHLDGGSYPGLI